MRHPTRATPDLHNTASPQTGFLTGDYFSTIANAIVDCNAARPQRRPSSLGGLGDEVEVAPSSPKARERARITVMNSCWPLHMA